MIGLESESTSASNAKWIVRLEDGAAVEAVLYRADTLCLSSQVGCAVRCPFCASGANGLGRSLRLDEMIGQVESVEALGHRLARVTVSGVGEPLHNPDALLDFIAWAHARRTPASLTTTGGRVDRLRDVLAANHNGVTISVHAGTEATRRAMVPHGPALADVFGALDEALRSLGRNRRKKLALAYLLVEGRNDTDDELDAFAERAKVYRVPVHLYALNPVPTSLEQPVGRERYEQVFARLREHGLVVRMSSRARLEANGGCGTLVAARIARGAPACAR